MKDYFNFKSFYSTVLLALVMQNIDLSGLQSVLQATPMIICISNHPEPLPSNMSREDFTFIHSKSWPSGGAAHNPWQWRV